MNSLISMVLCLHYVINDVGVRCRCNFVLAFLISWKTDFFQQNKCHAAYQPAAFLVGAWLDRYNSANNNNNSNNKLTLIYFAYLGTQTKCIFSNGRAAWIRHTFQAQTLNRRCFQFRTHRVWLVLQYFSFRTACSIGPELQILSGTAR